MLWSLDISSSFFVLHWRDVVTSGKIDEQNRGEELLTIIIKYQDL